MESKKIFIGIFLLSAILVSGCTISMSKEEAEILALERFKELANIIVEDYRSSVYPGFTEEQINKAEKNFEMGINRLYVVNSTKGGIAWYVYIDVPRSRDSVFESIPYEAVVYSKNDIRIPIYEEEIRKALEEEY